MVDAEVAGAERTGVEKIVTDGRQGRKMAPSARNPLPAAHSSTQRRSV